MSFPRYPKYKESGVEWLGQVPEKWEVKRLRFVANLNPSKSEIANLDRGTAVSFLPMDAVGDDGILTLDKEKTIGELETGYTYFRDGDVTIAKITPCYENGKGAIMRGLTNGIGFGTTELIVARPHLSQITSPYLNYLFISSDFRSLGESHMYGAGGQKRVPDAFVRNFASAFPPLPEQIAIASFLDRETAKIDALVAEQKRLIELLKEKRQAVISHAVTKGLNPNAKMKPSGIEWLGDVPEGWEVVALKHLVSRPVIDGPHESPVKLNEGIPFVSAESISQGSIDFDKKWGYISLKDHAEYSKRYSPKRGDILLVKLGATTGTPAIVDTDEEFNIWVPLAAIRLKSGIEPQYILQVLRSDNLKIAYELNWTYGTQQTLGLRTISNLRMPLPPANEQQAIITYLNSLLPLFESLTTEAQRAIDLLQERRSALISAAVTGQIDVRGLAPSEAA
jgi:type I restriction enzyme S subunit